MCTKSVCLAFLVLLIAPALASAQLLVHYPFDEATGWMANGSHTYNGLLDEVQICGRGLLYFDDIRPYRP